MRQLRRLGLSSNTALYDRTRPGARSRPSLPWGVQHGGSGPASQPGQGAHLAIMCVDLAFRVGPPQVQHRRGRTGTVEQPPVRHRGLLCARLGRGWSGLPHTAACLAGNLLTQLGLAEILNCLAHIQAQQCISCAGNKESTSAVLTSYASYFCAKINSISRHFESLLAMHVRVTR